MTKNLNMKSVQELIEIIDLLQTQLHAKTSYGLVWERDKTTEECEQDTKTGVQPTLLIDEERSFRHKEESPNHLLIEGDNLHALTILQMTHKEKVDVILIDPPYNTGQFFNYKDKFVNADHAYRHSKWLSFMEKRLVLAKDLLTDTGVILIHIDENEFAQLKLLCDEIFGESNRLSDMVVCNSTGSTAGHILQRHEYVLVYAKNKRNLPLFSYQGETVIDATALKKISRKNPKSAFKIPKGTRFDAPHGTVLEGELGDAIKVYVKEGKLISEHGRVKEDVVLEAGWAMKSQMESWFSGKETYDSRGQKVLEFYLNANGNMKYIKKKSVFTPPSVIQVKSTGSHELKNILGKIDAFAYPKPLDLIKYLLSFTTRKSSVVLDFFAGSGTTGHAVVELNQEDEGTRQFILCTNNEVNEKTRKILQKEGKSEAEIEETGICRAVTYPRLKQVMKEKGNLSYYQITLVEKRPVPYDG